MFISRSFSHFVLHICWVFCSCCPIVPVICVTLVYYFLVTCILYVICTIHNTANNQRIFFHQQMAVRNILQTIPDDRIWDEQILNGCEDHQNIEDRSRSWNTRRGVAGPRSTQQLNWEAITACLDHTWSEINRNGSIHNDVRNDMRQ